MEKLADVVTDVRENLERRVFKNEADISKNVVMRLFAALGWKVFDQARVASEFSIGNLRVDYALLLHADEPVVLVEVKRVGNLSTRGEDQLLDYCAKEKVPLAVFTDGRKWNFYHGKGAMKTRWFAGIDLVDDEKTESVRLLQRYLDFKAWNKGDAWRNIGADHERHRKRIVAGQHFEPSLKSLFLKECKGIVSIFCEEVRKRCGIFPDQREAVRFLTEAMEAEINNGGDPPPPPDPNFASLDYRGAKRTFKTNTDLFFAVFVELAGRDAGFYEKFAARFGHVRRRKEEFPGSTVQLRELPGGWWLNVHGSTETMRRRILMACDVAGVGFERELVVRFKTPESKRRDLTVQET